MLAWEFKVWHSNDERNAMTESAGLSHVIVQAIADTTVPRVDGQKLVGIYGEPDGLQLAAKVAELVREAVSMPIEWHDMTLAQGVNDILARFGDIHPELSQEALHEIGRCVGWNLR
jgi:hypothetical protein